MFRIFEIIDSLRNANDLMVQDSRFQWTAAWITMENDGSWKTMSRFLLGTADD